MPAGIPGVVTQKGAHSTTEVTSALGSWIFQWHLQERADLPVPLGSARGWSTAGCLDKGEGVSMCMEERKTRWT